MSENHTGGNAIPQIMREEHSGDINAKRVSLVTSATIDITSMSGVTMYQGSLVTVTAYGDKGVPIAQDSSTEALLTIDYAHHEVHSGSHYYVKDWVDIPASATQDFLFVTPNTTKHAHARWEVASEAEATFTLYEDAVTAANGSAVTIWNNNRNSANTPGVLAFSTPSVAAVGTEIYDAKIGSGRAVGGTGGREHELIAKQNTKYLFRITNNDGTATRWTGFDFNWYEHTPKN